ncbi:hypothetical protein [Lentibacillus amyloliquefaciens]|uniref:Uncharacterized protein n=1 Tax=Lentibacillus amyloliquefaciens TaxID=1472767 RepID=A0A0U4DSJ3_9BACI|nr:hypothetical protein [Lentibacillus amyloliquefaciens]ALX48296.1 hypothetical protein AOX59_06550 [Lentibacillus amyloliquefaciens]
MYTAIFGMFSFVWFGWAQENPRKNWRMYIGVASGTALLVCLIGVYLSVTHWDAATTLSEMDSLITYIIVFYAELIIGGLGAFLLIQKKKRDYVAPWIAFIVGAHFFWLVNVFKDPSLYILAVLMIVIAIISPWLSQKMGVANSAITGIGSGMSLFCFAILGLIRYLLA